MMLDKIICHYELKNMISITYFFIPEKAKDIKELAEKGVNTAKDKCKVQ